MCKYIGNIQIYKTYHGNVSVELILFSCTSLYVKQQRSEMMTSKHLFQEFAHFDNMHFLGWFIIV